MVFQSFNLFPHLTVLQNLTIAQRRVLKRSSQEAEEVAKHNMERVGLEYKIDAYPADLSGGQQQRAAVARSQHERTQAFLSEVLLLRLGTPSR